MVWNDLRDTVARVNRWDTGQRALRLRLLVGNGPFEKAVDDVLLVQSADIVESLNDGVRGHLTCLGLRDDLPLESFVGLPVEVQMATDTGDLRLVRGLVEQALRGHLDGSLTVYQLRLVDPLAFLRGRESSTFIANDASVIEVTDELLRHLQIESPAFGTTFAWTWKVDPARYPARAFWLQKSECLTSFLFRQWRRMGISWFFRPHGQDDRIELVLVDGSYQPEPNPAGAVRVRQRLHAATERAAITHWADATRFTAARVARATWDYKGASLTEEEVPSRVESSDWARNLAQGLAEHRIELPHAGNDWDDFRRLTRLRMDRHDLEHACATGLSGVAALCVGACNPVDDLPGRPPLAPHDRLYVFTSLHHQAESNLSELGEPAARLVQRSSRLEGWSPVPRFDAASEAGRSGHRYLNSFVAVKVGTPLVPPWDPDTDLPRMAPMTGVVAGRPGEQVDIDVLGRIQVTLPGERTRRRTAWVRLATFSAHGGGGALFPPPVGTEVRVSFEAGDESRPVIDHAYFNGRHPPPCFNNGGPLPGNRYLSGIHLHEIGSQRFGELLFDQTPGQTGVQLGSEHAGSRLLLGSLYGPRVDGHGKHLGDGIYLHTGASGSWRTGQDLLISAYGRPPESGLQMDSREHQDSLAEGLALQQDLGQNAATQQALATDDGPQRALLEDIARARAEPGATGKPTVSVAAPDGIAVSTRKTLVQVAGVNIDSVAGLNMQLTSGQRLVLNAGKGLSLFSHADGLRIVAAHGPLRLQSQHDSTQIDAAQDLRLTAVDGCVVAMAQKEIVLMLADGTYLKLSSAGIEMGSDRPLVARTRGHHWLGPDTLRGAMPRFGNADLGRTPRLISPVDGEPVEGVDVLVRSDDGDLAGTTDGRGHGPALTTDAYQKFKALFFRKRP